MVLDDKGGEVWVIKAAAVVSFLFSVFSLSGANRKFQFDQTN